MKREYLGWNRPPLQTACDWLLKNYSKAANWDLSGVIVVLPTSRACRRLLELLVIRAQQENLTLSPPKIETLGNLPEHLYLAKRGFASQLTQIQTLISVLRQTPKEILAKVAPFPPAANEHAAWRSLAMQFESTHRELASDRVTMEQVSAAAQKLGQKEEADRWAAMHTIIESYLQALDRLNLWDRQTARLVAFEKGEYQTTKDLVVLAAVDLNRTQRNILDAVSARVTILIAAPEGYQEGFDVHGALTPEFWCESNVEINEDSICIVSKPKDQAFATVKAVAGLAKSRPAIDIVVGVVDKEIAPILEASLGQAGAKPHLAEGVPLRRTAPFLLLKAIADWLRDPNARNLAALVRHPQVYAWLTKHDSQFSQTSFVSAEGEMVQLADLLTRLDKCIVDRLIDSIPRSTRNTLHLGMVAQLTASIDALLADVSGKARALTGWVEPISKVLAKLASAELPEGESTVAVWRAFADGCAKAWEEWQALPSALLIKVSAAEAIDLLCEAIEGGAANTRHDANALHLLGWLELPLDDAPAAVVTGFNEGRVPSAVHGDIFLPNTLRVELQLTDNRRRLARDAYALRLLMETKESVKLIAGRLDSAGDPILPSRLLFFAEPEKAAERMRSLFSKGPSIPRPLPALASRRNLKAASTFSLPEVRLDRIPNDYPASMRVTKFRDFLACGYRYYLKDIEKLEAIDDIAEELAPNRFGDLLHAVLSRFGADARMAEEKNPHKIEGYLNGLLDSVVGEFVSDARHAAFAVQLEQIRLRLRAFATWQSQWRKQGWEILHTEVELGGKHQGAKRAFLDVDRTNVELLGRIDRIDRKAGTNEIIVFDYKTSDEAKTPEKAHESSSRRSSGSRWRDLQLPLYQILAEALGHAESVRLGYIVLPKKSGETGERLAKWTGDDLADAYEQARKVIRALRQRAFKLTTPPPPYFEEYSAICQDRTLRAWESAEVGE